MKKTSVQLSTKWKRCSEKHYKRTANLNLSVEVVLSCEKPRKCQMFKPIWSVYTSNGQGTVLMYCLWMRPTIFDVICNYVTTMLRFEERVVSMWFYTTSVIVCEFENIVRKVFNSMCTCRSVNVVKYSNHLRLRGHACFEEWFYNRFQCRGVKQYLP